MSTTIYNRDGKVLYTSGCEDLRSALVEATGGGVDLAGGDLEKAKR